MALEAFEPYHDEEASGVLFQVAVLARRAQGYISCALLATLGGPASNAEAWVAVYRRHQPMIDAVVARRAPTEDWDTVMVRRSDLPPTHDSPTGPTGR